MRVLFLGPDTSPVLAFLREREDVRQTADPLAAVEADFIVSHGYRHIVSRDLCEAFDGRAVNLHIGYLPWNRGADPNLWSHIDATPSGVTIHYIAPGLDTGDVIAQRLVRFTQADTLATSYAKLQDAMHGLFVQWWPKIKDRTCPRIPQAGSGSYHRSADRQRVSHLLTAGWDTPVQDLRWAFDDGRPICGALVD